MPKLSATPAFSPKVQESRRHFDLHLEKEWKRLAREQQPLTLLLCDVDYFKQYNDTYGHQAGDRCLQEIAQVLKQVAKRPTDLVARYGGEEFALVLSNTDTAGATHLASQISAMLREKRIPHHASEQSQVAVSMGIATAIPSSRNVPQLIVVATDQALYSAKSQGRNRYCIAADWVMYEGSPDR